MARTTVDLDPELTKQLKHLAADTHDSMSRVVNRLLREALLRNRQSQPTTRRFHWNTVRGGRPIEGFNPASREYLDLLDEAP